MNLIDGHIKLYIKDTMGPIMGINDLCGELIRYIIECDEDKEVYIIWHHLIKLNK